MSVNWVFIAIIVLIFFSTKKVNKRNRLETSVYTKSMSNSIKGVATLLIVLHHVAWKLEKANILIWFYREINLFAVGIFLFFSGFGLLKSYNNGGVTRIKVIKYILRLLIPYFFVFFIKLLIDIYEKELNYSIIKSILTLQIPPSQLWYLKAQLVCYFLFILAGKLYKSNYSKMIMFVFSPILLWIIVSLLLGRDYINMAWYNTLPCFPIGMLVAVEEDKINKVIRKMPVKIILALTVFTLGLGFICFFVVRDLVYLLTAIYSVLFYLILSHYCVVCSKLWIFIGKHSLSIYLLHLQILDLFMRYQLDITNGITICCLLFETLIIAVILDATVDKIIKK